MTNYASVGVGICTINGSRRLPTVFDDIFKHTPGLPKENVYLIDDGSTPHEIDLIREICKHYGVAMGEHRRNQGISASWNHLTHRYLSKDYMTLLNDDIRLVPYWLDALVYFMEKNPSAGMVGLHARVDGKLTCTNAGVKKYEDDIDFSVPHRGICCNGFCFIIRPSEWKEVNYFDENYYSFCEECDFGMRLITLKGKFGYNIPWPVIDHEWGRTFFENPELLPDLRMKMSQDYFKRSWGLSLDKLYPKVVASEAPEVEWIKENGGLGKGKPIDVVR